MNKFLIRPVHNRDRDDLYALGQLAGKGMTSFPTTLPKIEAKIKASHDSFTGVIQNPYEQQFMLVLEDIEAGKVIGTSCVYALAWREDEAFHSYKLEKKRFYSEALSKEFVRDYLVLNKEFGRSSLIGTLFLHPDYRGKNVAKWLSRIRYLLMALNKEQFQARILAEIRGWIGPDGASPYWEGIGQKYFGISFQEGEALIRKQGYDFVYELMPQDPLPLFLLPEDCVNHIGKPHDESIGAMKILEKEGFSYEGHVDFFDGGPQLTADLKALKTVKDMVSFDHFDGLVNYLSKQSDQTRLFILGLQKGHSFTSYLVAPEDLNSGQLEPIKRAFSKIEEGAVKIALSPY